LLKKNLTKELPQEIKSSFQKTLAGSLNNMGYAYASKGESTLSFAYYQQSLKLDEEIGGKKGAAMLLNNIGVVYETQGNYF